jgi:hypothetical protein
MMRLGTVADGSGLLPGPLQLRAAPSDSADTLVTITRWQDVLSEEIAYEEPAVVVWRVAHPWYLVATRDSVGGWIRIPDGATMVPMADLLKDRLAYLTAAWNGSLHAAPGDAVSRSVDGVVRDDGETSANVLDTRLVGDTLWVQVQVHDESPCTSTADPKVIGEGWVRAWTGGKPTVWYYSRGC